MKMNKKTVFNFTKRYLSYIIIAAVAIFYAVLSFSGGAKTADEVFENVTKGVAKRTNSIVLQHDTRDFSVDAVERIIAWGLCNGYTFRALDINSPASHHGVNN